MRFFREININNVTQEYINNLEQENALLIYKEDSIEIWVKKEEMNRFKGVSNV